MTPTPPAVPRALLLRALGESAQSRAIEGDVLEDFTLLAARKGERAARRWYWREAITLSVTYAVRRMIDPLKPRNQPRTSDRTMANSLGTFGLARDLRYALRAIRREPAFFAFAVLIIGIGVGACTAVFSVISPLMLRSLPFHDPDQLVWIANSGDPQNGMSAVTSRTSNVRDFRNLSESFEGITGYNAFFGQGRYNLSGGGEPERLVGAGVAGDFLEVLAVNPLHGRNFVAEEAEYNGRPAVILTNGFWRRRFAGDPAIVGTSININGTPTNVVGVLPRSFNFASIFAPSTRVDFLLPWPISDETDRQGNTTSMIARLKPGVTVESAQAELDVIVAQLQEQFPDRWGLGATVSPLQAKIAGAYRTGMLVLAAAAGTVMLIVCVNVSNLLLARGPKRTREMAVRAAVGASRFRMLRQLVVESVVLTLGGAVIGVATAVGATGLVASSTGLNIPLLRTVSVDGQALLFTLGLALVAGLVMGIVPALQTTRGVGVTALSDLSRGSSAGRRSTRLREGLVVIEMAMACLLLVLAGLFLKSFRNILDVELGFQPNNAVGWTLSTNRQFENIEEMTTFFDQVVQRVEAVPGVEMAGLIDALPLGRNRTWGTISAPDLVYDDDELQSAFPHLVDHRYLTAMQIPLVAGRNFTSDDNREGPRVVILNESAARGVFQGQEAVGRTVLNVGRELQVVGVVGDVRHQSLEQTSGWQMYYPYSQIWDFQTLDMVVRSRLPLETLVPGVAAALREIDATMPTDEYQSLNALVDRSVSPRRFILLLLSAFGGTALLLGALGIYGVLSYSVAERTPEIGIRMALGESGSQLRLRVVGKTMVLAGTGVAIGAALSFVGTRWIGALLYGVEPTDPLTFAGMAIVLLVTSALAGYIPARRASRIDPTTAFRSV
jgi:predicted permease